ncbi:MULTISPECIES: hypothetical protein [Sinorhizobium]|uniref:Uncharacterized protein n=2 Tax=Sinorhizobium TaxID=28105 RepID=A0AAW9TY34_RHIML|nr:MULTISPECIES: hypothetical protein [Sinorhizobium]ARS66392.1 hypothetical protein SMRU11_03175 [Sinorhizobium meliloti RU11/001]TWA93467.1 hypothetical protein FB000_12517 [Ensifer sp. SEMIA 134]TWB29249.1 hypothetical protein FB001_12417 [Ensifer sp. SEMIA 135]AEG07765.1 hypothetical protein SinmeB_6681 [Sinorhizobium meliloti BL225C]AEG57675.1 hypothetical protein Sinme_6181 [Sinorhizobium meliloti AK83]
MPLAGSERTEGQEGDEQKALAHTIASGSREPAMMPAIIRRTISGVATSTTRATAIHTAAGH